MKTTAVQDGAFFPEHNKLLPSKLTPRAHLEVREGDVLITCAGPRARCGVSCLVRGTRRRLILSGKMYRFRPNPDLMRPEFLEAYLRSPEAQRAIDRMKTGISDSGLNLTHDRFLHLPVPVPALDAQREIIEHIEKQFTRLDAGVAALKRVQAHLKRCRASVLKAACEGRLVPTEAEIARREGRSYETGAQLLERILQARRDAWAKQAPNGRKKKYAEPKPPDTTALPELPEGWVWATPEHLATDEDAAICAGPFGTIFKAKDFRDSGVPIIFLRHVAPGRYLTHKPGFMDPQKWEELFRPYSVFGGELLITKLGEPPGACATYPEAIGPAMVTPDVIKMSVDPVVADKRYLMNYLNSPLAQRTSSGAAFGSTRLRLTLPLFRGMPIPLPPLAEQQRIVSEIDRRLSELDDLEATVAASLQRAGRLRQAVLQAAFRGCVALGEKDDGEF